MKKHIIEDLFDTAMIQLFDKKSQVKCKKGHRYIKETFKDGNLISSRWVCKNCNRELK